MKKVIRVCPHLAISPVNFPIFESMEWKDAFEPAKPMTRGHAMSA